MRIASVLLISGLTLAAWPWCAAHAAGATPTVVEPVSSDHAAAVPSERMAEMVSAPGEGEFNFMKRVGQRLTAYAQQENVEFCARLATRYVPQSTDSGYLLYGVVITTNHSHLVCVEQDQVPEGFTVTTKTIHNHGLTPRFRVNAADLALTGRQFHRNQVVGERVQDQFSPQDLLEPGYLATPTGLLYQDGQGRQRDLGAYAPPAATLDEGAVARLVAR